MSKIHKTLYEFLAAPQTKPSPTAPPKPANPPAPKPVRPPSPIRRDKPSTNPRPAAKTEEGLYKKFIDLLRSSKSEVKVNLNKIKER